MWQLLLAAAIAGSTGLVAKHFLSPTSSDLGPKCEPPFESGYESNFEQGIFRFSSSGSSGKKFWRKKKSGTSRRLEKYDGVESERSAATGGVVSRRRFAVRLKKRRKTAARCGSSCFSSKDSNLFGHGVGIGMMCMMSAGKDEISRLSAAMDETYKIVRELKNELYRRKSTQLAQGSQTISNEHGELVHNRSRTEERESHNAKLSGLLTADDVDCPSSVLTEEPEPEELGMNRLEAELESELQKLPWSTDKVSGNEADILEEQNAISYQCQGISPSELDQKLCHLLIEQQENQIVGLESELNAAQSKLLEKEAELQALKDCVRRLTEFSISTGSDDEGEQQTEQGCTSEWNSNLKLGLESRKSEVGMKRPIDYA